MTRSKFAQFLNHRHSLLVQYRMGDLSKQEFIDGNYWFLEELGIHPFERVDNVKKAIYNYHFHNAKAKYFQRMANDRRASEAERRDAQEISIDHYREKDSATLKLLRLIDFRHVSAYMVHVYSSKLKDKLIEIVLSDPDLLLEISSIAPMHGAVDGDDLVLHTRSEMIGRVLKENGVFQEEKRNSLTGSYINQMY